MSEIKNFDPAYLNNLEMPKISEVDKNMLEAPIQFYHMDDHFKWNTYSGPDVCD